MNPYQFQFEEFALSEEGVHLLRNGFNYKTVYYRETQNATLTKAIEIKNAPVIFALGVLMLLFAFYQSRWVLYLFTDTNYDIYIESIILPLIALSFGIYCIYTPLRKGPVLLLDDGTSSYKLRLRAVYKSKMAGGVENYLRDRLGPKYVRSSTALPIPQENTQTVF